MYRYYVKGRGVIPAGETRGISITNKGAMFEPLEFFIWEAGTDDSALLDARVRSVTCDGVEHLGVHGHGDGGSIPAELFGPMRVGVRMGIMYTPCRTFEVLIENRGKTREVELRLFVAPIKHGGPSDVRA
jgi:hypothetical protein